MNTTIGAARPLDKITRITAGRCLTVSRWRSALRRHAEQGGVHGLGRLQVRRRKKTVLIPFVEGPVMAGPVFAGQTEPACKGGCHAKPQPLTSAFSNPDRSGPLAARPEATRSWNR